MSRLLALGLAALWSLAHGDVHDLGLEDECAENETCSLSLRQLRPLPWIGCGGFGWSVA